ncbi:excinuclease ABC subunit C [Caloramator quimbayensis]|uniref:Excinuclease ABC subunit C n=1 Tax=Caloramator quimbayensis TaxID=1147123 RepID=A0A1T4XQ12_9CLOT|nr:GIY-YIG nuclease family protein [Caloramator quimbayensis]SKA91165.1 excinuclease ABC subunit C [Caloramator quimbayensis]
MNLKEKAKMLPSSPGVYLMKNSHGSIIYIGKSKNLKNRVESYFTNSSTHSPKVIKLIKNIKDFDYIVTDTEFEAFLLECKLIKEIKPIFNSKMKNPNSYCYIKIEINRKYPNIEISDEFNIDDGNIYFGPYTNKNTVLRAIQGIKECCRILCSNDFLRTSKCLNYSLGLCIGMCFNDNAKEQYNDVIHKITNLLYGTDREIIELIKNKMITSSEKYDFESAAKYRDYLSAVNYLVNKIKVIEFIKKNRNILLFEKLNSKEFKIFLLKGIKILFNKKYMLLEDNFKEIACEISSNISYYFNNNTFEKSVNIEKNEADESQIIYSYLKNKSNNCSYFFIPYKKLNKKNMKIDTKIESLLKKSFATSN